MRVQYFLVCLVAGLLSICTISVQLLGYNPFSDDSGVQRWNHQRQLILSDQDSLVSDDFEVQENLQKRVEFWFDVYSRYSGYHKIIHHNLYPWIIYEVVDVRGIKNSEKYMKTKIKNYKKLFKGLALKKDGFSLSEKKWLALFDQASNSKKVLKTAASKIRYQTGQRDSIKSGLLRSQKYLPHMEQLFIAEGMPTELTRLPFVESSFNWEAYSRVGAAGMWQFMRRTGRKFLRINKSIDERMSPLKSTKAAALLLKQNHKILYKTWPLAVTAYNHGPTGLRRAVRKTHSRDLANIIKRYRHPRFSFASANFYSCFLAVLYIEKYSDILFPDIPQGKAQNFQERIISSRVKAQKFLKAMNYSSDEFLRHNPDFTRAVKRNYYIPRGTKYFVPTDTDALQVADNSI